MSRPPCYLSLGSTAHAAAIDAIERASFSRPWTAGQIREVLHAGRVALLRSVDAGVIAYCVFHRVAGELQIQTVAVMPGLRRCGLARALLQWLVDAATRDGLELAVLEVRASNEPARNLYAQLGFRDLAASSPSSADPPEAALVLSRTLGEPSRD